MFELLQNISIFALKPLAKQAKSTKNCTMVVQTMPKPYSQRFGEVNKNREEGV
jgi:hypothetical protein